MRCPFCSEEIVVHPQPTLNPKPWFELVCGACGRRAGGEKKPAER
jgi:DNA-directed RNA polymerase subunit RPC12/RpoP